MSSIFDLKILKSPLEQLVNLQTPTKEDSVDPSLEVIKSITPEGNRLFEGERPNFKKVDLQQSYANSEFLSFLEDFFEQKGRKFDCSIAIYLSASISDKSIEDIFCEAMNEYKERNGLY